MYVYVQILYLFMVYNVHRMEDSRRINLEIFVVWLVVFAIVSNMRMQVSVSFLG